MKFFCLNILVLFFIKCSTAELQFIPPSREVDVIESGEYTFGVKEDDSTNITRCYYSTNTGINGYFDVAKQGPTTPPPNTQDKSIPLYALTPTEYQVTPSLTKHGAKVIRNEITHHGNIGDCRMTIKWVDDKGPTQWTLTPFNNKTGKPSENLPPITYKVNFFYKVALITKETITIFESGSFFQYLNATNIKFQSCQLKFDGTTMDLDLHSTKTNTFLTPYSVVTIKTLRKRLERTANKISSLGYGLCGFKLTGATKTENLEWTLTGTDSQGKRHRAIFKTFIHDKLAPSVLNTKKLVIVGDSAVLNCGSQYNQEFCNLYDPSGKYVFTNWKKDCSHTINSVGMGDLGVWKCITGHKRTMTYVTYTVEFVAKSEEPVETWVNETSNYINIGCRLTNTYRKDGISLCRMIAPNKEVFTLQPGAATDRYLSFGTDLTQAICAMEIPKPLQDYEHGIWRCEVYLGRDPTGGYITVGKAKLPDYPRYLKITKQLDQSLRIQCDVPFTSQYCHIKAPDGTIYSADNEDEARLGMCSHDIANVNATHNGTWVCSFAREIGVPDEEISVEVTVAEVLQYYRTVEVDAGSNAQLICSSGGLPLSYCRFIAPNGKAYHIPNHQKSQSMSYYGRGLEYGECGITISNAQPSDSGYWTCVTRISSGYAFKQTKISARIMLEVTPGFFDDPNIAAAIGIAVGVVVVSSMVGVVAMRRWRRRRHAAVPATSTAPRRINDGDNNSENIDIFHMGPPIRLCTSPEPVADDPHAHQL